MTIRLPDQGLRGPLAFFFATLLLGLSLVLFRPGPTVLIGGDSGCYARVAKELAERPFTNWFELTLGGAPFFEHPPLGLWLSGLAVRLFGSTPLVLVSLARFYASLTLLIIAATAFTLARRRNADGFTIAGYSVLGAITLPGFLYESQVAMLEAPLGVALAAGLWAIAAMTRGGVAPIIAFASATTAAFWIKGPPALVLLGVLVVVTTLRWVRWPIALGSAIAAIAGIGASTTAFDLFRAGQGVERFFARYLERQVFPSVIEGRHQPDSNPFFYVGPTLSWYGPAVAALLIGLVFLVRKKPLPDSFILGATLWLGVIVGFSLPVQKYQWYVHPGLVGAALVVGSVLSLIPERAVPFITRAAFVAAVAWPLIRFVPWEGRLSPTQQQTLALQRATGPTRGQAIADCSPMDPWVSGHLIGFLFDAVRVDCSEPAPWRFDGQTITGH